MTDQAEGALAPRPGMASRMLAWLDHRVDRERDQLFLWLAPAFGIGIAAYFSLPGEPSLLLSLSFVACASAVVLALQRGGSAWLFAVGLLAASAGFLNGQIRTAWVAAPIVQSETGPATITGRVESFQPMADGSFRLLLAPDSIERIETDNLPARVSLRVRVRDAFAEAGGHVRLAGVLMPPPDASEPGGFDYARQAYFDRIGAVGYAISAPEPVAAPVEPSWRAGASIAVEQLRSAIARRIEASIGGEAGGIAAALVTGYRGGIPDDAQEALRAAGLAHILAISGLHMMLVVGALFFGVRALLAISATLALTRPIKKWAAAAALCGGAIYLVLSGGSIATQRAFIMAAIMMIAILVDRPAITLRNVAIAAMAILIATPEALMSASFQMSFAATIALVAGYEALRDRPSSPGSSAREGRVGTFVGRYVMSLVMTALIAGLATGPYSAFHFNRVAVYTLVGNVAAMPFVGTLVMPPGLIAMCLMPFGLDWPFLWVMGQGIDLVLLVARTVAGWEGAVYVLPAFSGTSLGLMTIGGLWLALWRERWRAAGLAIMAAGVVAAGFTPKPELFISRDAGMVALRGEDGGLTFLPRPSSRYVAERWLRASGDQRLPGDAGLTASRSCDPIACVASRPGLSVALVTHPAAFLEECREVRCRRFAPRAALMVRRSGDRHRPPRGGSAGGHHAETDARRNRRGYGRPAPRRPTLEPTRPGRRARYRGPGRLWPLVLPDEADEPPLYPHAIGAEDAGLIGGIGRFERNGGALAAQALERRLLIVDECDDDVSGIGGIGLADDHRVAVEDTGVDHRIAAHLQREMLAARQQIDRHLDRVAVILDGGDRHAGGDPAHHRHGDRRGVVALFAATLGHLAETPLDDARSESATARGRKSGRDRLGQPHDLERPGPMRQATDEPALLERRDQAMDPGLGPEIERLLHLVERGRHAGLLQTFMDEHQKFVLLPGQHRPLRSLGMCRIRRIVYKSRTRLLVPVVFGNGKFFVHGAGLAVPGDRPCTDARLRPGNYALRGSRLGVGGNVQGTHFLPPFSYWPLKTHPRLQRRRVLPVHDGTGRVLRAMSPSPS